MSAPQPGSRIVVLGCLFEGGLGLLAWGIGQLTRQPVLAHFRWDPADALIGLGASLPLLVLFVAAVHWPVGPLRRIRRFVDEVIRPLFASCSAAELALLALAAGVGEEMLFRGLIQGALVHWLGAGLGVAGASLLFGTMHPITPAYVLLAGLMGAFLGWLWLATDNLLAPITTHAVYDWIALLYLVRRPAAPSNEPADQQ